MSQRTPFIILQEVQDSIVAITKYLQGIDEMQFKLNIMLQDAVVQRLEIISY